jgi:hypothetical protein
LPLGRAGRAIFFHPAPINFRPRSPHASRSGQQFTDRSKIIHTQREQFDFNHLASILHRHGKRTRVGVDDY